MEEKYTKKAPARILKEVLKVNPKASGFTSLDQAFVILMEHWDMELSIEKDEGKTTCILHRDDDKPMTWDFDQVWDEKQGDWDWNTIYKVVLETIIKEKLYKRPKLGKRALAKLAKEKAAKKPATEPTEPKEEVITISTLTKEEKLVTVSDLKRRKGNLSVKKSDWKKKGKDITEIENEISKINAQIKLLTKTE